MSEHTPGPWAVVGKSEGDGIVCFVGSLEVVTTTDKDPLEYGAEADARLIAAAPDLLKALDEVTDFWWAGAEPPSQEEIEPYLKIIAKAKGE